MDKQDIYNSKAAFKIAERLDGILIDIEVENFIETIISKKPEEFYEEISAKNEGGSFLVNDVHDDIDDIWRTKKNWEKIEEEYTKELKDKMFEAIKKADTFDEMAYYLIEDGVSPYISIALALRFCDHIEKGINLAQEIY